MRKLVVFAAFVGLCGSLVGETNPKKVYVNIHSDRSDTQFGIVDGVISMQDSISGEYRRYIIRSGRFDKQIVLKRNEIDKKTFVNEMSSANVFCPHSHPHHNVWYPGM